MTKHTDHTLDDLLNTLEPPKASPALRAAVIRAGSTAAAPAPQSAPWTARLLDMLMRPAPVMAALMLAVAIGWALPDPVAGTDSGRDGVVVAAVKTEDETSLAEATEAFLFGDLEGQNAATVAGEAGESGVTLSAFASDDLLE